MCVVVKRRGEDRKKFGRRRGTRLYGWVGVGGVGDLGWAGRPGGKPRLRSRTTSGKQCQCLPSASNRAGTERGKASSAMRVAVVLYTIHASHRDCKGLQ